MAKKNSLRIAIPHTDSTRVISIPIDKLVEILSEHKRSIEEQTNAPYYRCNITLSVFSIYNNKSNSIGLDSINKKKKESKGELDDSITDNDYESWSTLKFIELINHLFKKAYGKEHIGFAGMAKGGMISKVKSILIFPMLQNGFTKTQIHDYIVWAYSVKYQTVDFPITLSFLKSESLQTEWTLYGGKNSKRKNRSKRDMIFGK